jgi:UDP-N-acetylglucosamine 2-epimerase (non-hydrolysing)
VEAGLRSFDRTMPEEINRLLTDQISDFLFTPSPDADENLKKEGIPEDKIFLVGNVMVDSLLFNLEKAKKSSILERLGLRERFSSDHCLLPTANCLLPSAYCLLTLHRPSNVDDKDSFLRIINALTEISKHIPIIFPIHPRTRKQIESFGFQKYFSFLELNPTNSINQTNLSRLPRSESVRGLPCSEVVRGLSCSESVRDEMRPALWSMETTTWGAYFTGTRQTKETT